jgi:hypothetical protein
MSLPGLRDVLLNATLLTSLVRARAVLTVALFHFTLAKTV